METVLSLIIGLTIGTVATYLFMRGRGAMYREQLEFERRTYDTQLALFKEQVTTATEAMLKERAGELQASNIQQFETLLGPLRADINRMEKSMDDTRDVHTKTTADLSATMRQMMERTMTIGEQADRLSNALQRKNKVMGNWGELILTDLLESQGLRRGYEFDVQQAMRDEEGHIALNDETGSRMIPDVVLHLADNRDVIIDAKMSLTAYVDYVNASTDDEREEAAVRHVLSIRNHVKELSVKDYARYVAAPRINSDFVIMFVPNDGAMQLLLQRSPEVWNDALNNRKVFIVGSQTLIAALRIIDLTWQRVNQERNTQRIMAEAAKLVDRVKQFCDKFTEVGARLDAAQKAYQDVIEKAKDGRQSILASGRHLEELGVRGKTLLPPQ